MYIRITSKCNMHCAHCCYNCTKEGQNMTLRTYRRALELSKDYGSSPFLGGGEPTLHPQFERFLCEGIATAAEIGEGTLGIVTNGSLKRRAMMLAAMAKGEVIYASLSQDEFHDPIDPEVVWAFEQLPHDGIRDVTHGGSQDPLPAGRAKDLLGWNEDEERDDSHCPCESWVVEPDGTIHQCGCDDSPVIGHVDTGVESPMQGVCHRSNEFVEEYA